MRIGAIVLLYFIGLSLQLTWPATASGSPVHQFCETRLFQAKQFWIRNFTSRQLPVEEQLLAWEERLYDYIHNSPDSQPEDLERRAEVAGQDLDFWYAKLRKLLKDRGLYEADLEMSYGLPAFQVKRSRLEELYPTLKIKDAVTFVVDPFARVVQNSHAGYVQQQTAIVLPRAFSIGVPSRLEFKWMLHELVHHRLAERRRVVGDLLFETHFAPTTNLKADLRQLGQYSDYFTSEEIVARVVTAWVDGQEFCEGAEYKMFFPREFDEAGSFLETYLNVILPTVQAELSEAEDVKVIRSEEGLSITLSSFTLESDNYPETMSKSYLLGQLQRERQVLLALKEIMSRVRWEREGTRLSSLCRERENFWRWLRDLRVDTDNFDRILIR